MNRFIGERHSPQTTRFRGGRRLSSRMPDQLRTTRAMDPTSAPHSHDDPLDELGLLPLSPFRSRPSSPITFRSPVLVEGLESQSLATSSGDWMARAVRVDELARNVERTDMRVAELRVAGVREDLAHYRVQVADVREELACAEVRVAEIREELARIAETARAEVQVREDLARAPAIWSSNREHLWAVNAWGEFASNFTFHEAGWQSMMSSARNAATDTDEFDSLVEQLLDMGFDMEQISRTIHDLCVSGATFLDTNLVIHSMITDQLSHSEDDVLFRIRDAEISDISEDDDDDDDDDDDRYWVAHIVVDVAVAEARPPDDFICAICLDTPTTMSHVASIRGCTHKFCYDCINTWAEQSNKCPCCNMRFHTIERFLPSNEVARGQGLSVYEEFFCGL